MRILFDEIRTDQSGKKLVILPLSRMVFDEPFSVGSYHFFPAGSIEVESLRPIPNKTLESLIHSSGSEIQLQGQNLREVESSLTGFGVDILASSPLVAFSEEIDWDKFLEANHKQDIALIKCLSSKAERALDMLRFEYCQFDLPDTLPGLAGSWDGSGQYLGALVYSSEDHESYLIAGAAVECSVVVRGIGLEITSCISMSMPQADEGEVAAVFVHALTLHSDAMTAPNDTIKFMRIFTLLDFLANPDSSDSWSEQKGNIICHCANDRSGYHAISERFKELTKIRADIVHQGKYLTELLPDQGMRKELFREMQNYAHCVLDDMFQRIDMTWREFADCRKKLIQINR